MTELAGALVHAGLGFVDQRLQMIDQAFAGAGDLAAALGGAGAGADLAGADAELVQARAELVAFRGLLGQPVSSSTSRDAAGHLGAALQHANHAVELVRPGTNLQALLAAPFAAPVVPAGLGQQLGLSVPGGVALGAGPVLTYRVASAGPVTMVAGPPALRATAARLRADLRIDGGSPALTLGVELDGLGVDVSGPSFDDFVNALLGAGSSATADVSIGVDSDRGVTVGGATHGPVSLPARGSSPLIEVHGMTLAAPADAPGTIDVGVVVAGSLGSAVRFTIDGIGLSIAIDPDQVGRGMPATVKPKPPHGVGASLDGGLLRGGGYLDVHDGTYAGVLDVRLGPIEAKAFGILDTHVPGGFSLIVAISAEFFPPIEIALGFTLNGVGGIVGIERALNTDTLRARLHDHAIDNLLFPADPVSAAPEILRTLGAVFPPLRHGVVVGPMVKMGWGRPVSFVTASLGVIVALPDPKVVILGSFRLAVPAPELPIVDLKGAVYSEITPDRVLVLVILEDSRVAGYPVAGDLGFFVRFGGSPDFAISAGGFHPRYTPPPELADMRRLSIDLSPPALLTIRATAYVAFTSNSFQLGGRLEASGDAGPVGVHGFIQLDAIVRWAPSFSFEADLGAGFDMRFMGESFAGVELHLHLQGPAPWMAHGTATLELPILPDVDVEVGPITWGDADNPPPPVVHPLDLVRDELAKAAAWRAELPQGADGLVTLVSRPEDPALLVHPLGLFEGRERSVPLEKEITRVGASPAASGETRIHLGQPTVTDGAGAPVPVGAISPVEDHFAPGQFLDLSEDDKLRRPAFEDMLAGIRLGPPGGIVTDAANATQSELHYDTFYPHQDIGQGPDVLFSLKSAAYSVLRVGAAGRSVLRADIRYASKPDPIVLAAAGDVKIRAVADLSVPAGMADVAMTHWDAADLLAARGDAAALQLVALGTAS